MPTTRKRTVANEGGEQSSGQISESLLNMTFREYFTAHCSQQTESLEQFTQSLIDKLESDFEEASKQVTNLADEALKRLDVKLKQYEGDEGGR